MLDELFVRVNTLLSELRTVELGFSLGDNVVFPAQPARKVEEVLKELGVHHLPDIYEFYCLCDGISWPDIHNGYFIKPVDTLVESHPESEPIAICGHYSESVLTIGSSGGGDLFVLGRESRDVLLLPPGLLISGLYTDTDRRIRKCASNYGDFFRACANDLAAFIRGTPGYVFLT
jgi:hypothetical protein